MQPRCSCQTTPVHVAASLLLFASLLHKQSDGAHRTSGVLHAREDDACDLPRQLLPHDRARQPGERAVARDRPGEQALRPAVLRHQGREPCAVPRRRTSANQPP